MAERREDLSGKALVCPVEQRHRMIKASSAGPPDAADRAPAPPAAG
jgi:hypothetical protein